MRSRSSLFVITAALAACGTLETSASNPAAEDGGGPSDGAPSDGAASEGAAVDGGGDAVADAGPVGCAGFGPGGFCVDFDEDGGVGGTQLGSGTVEIVTSPVLSAPNALHVKGAAGELAARAYTDVLPLGTSRLRFEVHFRAVSLASSTVPVAALSVTSGQSLEVRFNASNGDITVGWMGSGASSFGTGSTTDWNDVALEIDQNGAHRVGEAPVLSKPSGTLSGNVSITLGLYAGPAAPTDIFYDDVSLR